MLCTLCLAYNIDCFITVIWYDKNNCLKLQFTKSESVKLQLTGLGMWQDEMRPGLNLEVYLKFGEQKTNTGYNIRMYKKHSQFPLSQKTFELVLSSPVDGYLLCNFLPKSTALTQNSLLDQAVTYE